MCPWTLARSWEHLSTSFSFPSLSFLLPFFSLFLVWVSLDAFVIAGNLLFSFLGVSLDACVVAANTFSFFPFFIFFLLFSPYPSLPRARCVHIQKTRCNRFSMRSGFIGSCPLYLFPFSPCLGVSFLLSFAHTSVPALVCTRAFTCTSKPRFQVAQVVHNEVAPVHLVPLHRNYAHFCPLVLSSCLHLFVLRAHAHVCPNLSFSRLPSGRRVCVCVTLGVTHRDPFGLFFALMSLLPTKLLMSWEDIGADHSDVPQCL